MKRTNVVGIAAVLSIWVSTIPFLSLVMSDPAAAACFRLPDTSQNRARGVAGCWQCDDGISCPGSSGGGCPAGEIATTSGGCMPIGATECGNGHCDPGKYCANSGRSCFPNGSVDCGDFYCPAGNTCGRYRCLAPGSVECRDGGTCDRGFHCSRDGQRCVPNGTAECGNGHCDPGNYCANNNHSCFPNGSVDCGNDYCPHGEACSSGGGCVPEGKVDCGQGSYCELGFACKPGGGCLLTGSDELARFCPNGRFQCGKGRVCTKDNECEYKIKTIDIWIRSFIPIIHEGNPGYTLPLPTNPAHTMIRDPNWFSTSCYLTDQRQFSDDPEASVRMGSHVVIKTGELATVVVSDKSSSQSVEISCETGAERCRKPVDMSRTTFGLINQEGDALRLRVHGEANNACFRGAPSIQYDGEFVVDLTEGTIKFDGTVGKFPAFEAYARANDGTIQKIFQEPPVPRSTVLWIPLSRFVNSPAVKF
jgi:hypothetical protein